MLTKPFSEWAPEAFEKRMVKPLSLYVHVPFCRHRCLFCPFYQNQSREGFSAEYRDLLLKEIFMVAKALGPVAHQRPANAVFFGGGTPSDMQPEDLAAVLRALKSHFLLAEDAEVTIEGRVRDFSREKAEAWVAAGATRFSLGLQSTDAKLRRRLGRLADREEIKATLTGLKASGALVIVDLMFGLPGQDQTSLAEDVRFLAQETPIDGLTLYELIQFPHSPLAKAVESGRLGPPASGKERARMYAHAAHTLAEFGFEHFTPQHWRRNECERSLYNRLAKADADMLPFGVSAGGSLDGISLQHERDVERYRSGLEAGQLPVRALRAGGGRHRFPLQLAEALERRSLPPLADWPEGALAWARPLLENWEQAGLLEEIEDQNVPPRLSLAGCYWSKQVKQAILSCLMSAQAGHPGNRPQPMAV